LPDAVDFVLAGSSAIPADLLDRARAGAEAIGYAHGWSQGVREARQLMAAEQSMARAEQDRQAEAALHQINAIMTSLAAASAAIEAQAAESAEDDEPALIAAAVTIAEALVGHELRETTAATRDALARMLQLAPRDEPTIIRINAEVHAALGEAGVAELLASITGASGRHIAVEPDDTLAVGDAFARFGSTTIDGRLSEGIRRIREQLR
jgi:flagellar assembly protein FliH